MAEQLRMTRNRTDRSGPDRSAPDRGPPPAGAAARTPAVADFEARVRASFAGQGVMALIGATLGAVRPGPAQGERIVAEGFVVKPGRTLAITRGEVHAERGGTRVPVALMQQTLIVMRGNADA